MYKDALAYRENKGKLCEHKGSCVCIYTYESFTKETSLTLKKKLNFLKPFPAFYLHVKWLKF